jgi:hypothetical protein
MAKAVQRPFGAENYSAAPRIGGCKQPFGKLKQACRRRTQFTAPMRHIHKLRPIPIFRWPLVWALVCLQLAVALVWASQVGLTIGGWEICAGAICALLALSAAYRLRIRGIANLAEASALWIAFVATTGVLSYLAASCAFPLQDVMLARLDRAIGFD